METQLYLSPAGVHPNRCSNMSPCIEGRWKNSGKVDAADATDCMLDQEGNSWRMWTEDQQLDTAGQLGTSASAMYTVKPLPNAGQVCTPGTSDVGSVQASGDECMWRLLFIS